MYKQLGHNKTVNYKQKSLLYTLQQTGIYIHKSYLATCANIFLIDKMQTYEIRWFTYRSYGRFPRAGILGYLVMFPLAAGPPPRFSSKKWSLQSHVYTCNIITWIYEWLVYRMIVEAKLNPVKLRRRPIGKPIILQRLACCFSDCVLVNDV